MNCQIEKNGEFDKLPDFDELPDAAGSDNELDKKSGEVLRENANPMANSMLDKADEEGAGPNEAKEPEQAPNVSGGAEGFSVAEAAEQALRERDALREQREEESAQKMLVPQIKQFRAYQAPVSSLIHYDPEAEQRNAQIDSETEEAGEALLQTLKNSRLRRR